MNKLPCVACGTRTELSCAHILRTRKDAVILGQKFEDDSNFLPLCGSRGRQKTCHDAFDTNKLCFVAVPNGEDDDDAACTRQWVVLTREEYRKDVKCVTIPTGPSRRLLHVHARRFFGLLSPEEKGDLLNEICKVTSEARGCTKVNIEAWLNETTPEVSPGSTLVCASCNSKENLFLDKNDTPYCAGCWAAHQKCDVCDKVTLQSVSDVVSHFRGKKHNQQSSRNRARE